VPPAVVLLTRDLRVHDHPALAEAARGFDRQVPLFVLDDEARRRHASANRIGFLVESLADLRASLRHLGADLVVRRGDVVAEAVGLAVAVGAGTLLVAEDVTAYARRRQARLAAACTEAGVELRLLPGITVVPPAAVRTGAGGRFKVFTPFSRAWERHPRRPVLGPPDRLRLPDGLDPGAIPDAADLVDDPGSPHRVRGGEAEGRRRMEEWLTSSLAAYDDHRDALALDDTSRLSASLHLGCVSALELEREAAAAGGPGAAAYVRQLCWRDFHHHVTDGHPTMSWRDLHPRGDAWRGDEGAFTAWAEGRTGVPLVDAGMRQLRDEGWMHNRARLVTASFLVKDLDVDWRRGAAHFLRWLVDGDVVNNSANWQWVAGTGSDTRPYRVLNPYRQAERFDPDGAYVRRWVPELADGAGVPAAAPADGQLDLLAGGYPPPIVDHGEAAAAYRARHP
jgi:deoxyribodipyrimidine photo-lyase